MKRVIWWIVIVLLLALIGFLIWLWALYPLKEIEFRYTPVDTSGKTTLFCNLLAFSQIESQTGADKWAMAVVAKPDVEKSLKEKVRVVVGERRLYFGEEDKEGTHIFVNEDGRVVAMSVGIDESAGNAFFFDRKSGLMLGFIGDYDDDKKRPRGSIEYWQCL